MCGVSLREGGVGARISVGLFNDWEMDKVHSFLLGLNEKSVQWDLEDRVLWIETKCGKFSVKSLYKDLESGPSASFPLNVIWKSCVQPK